MSDLIAAIKAGRHYVGYDTQEEYVRLAERRIGEYKQQFTIPSFVEKEGDFVVLREDQEAYTTENI